MLEKLILGTAQFALPYGVMNTAPTMTEETVHRILNFAAQNAVTTLDTAVNYGNCQQLLGSYDLSTWQVVSKLPKIPERADSSSWIEETVLQSLEDLGISALQALLLHNPEQLLSNRGEQIYQSLEELRAKGLIKTIGLSLHKVDCLEPLLERYCFDIIQAPFNIFDKRITHFPWFESKAVNFEWHARSVFLQGLLLADAHSLPQQFTAWKSHFQQWWHHLAKTNMKALPACLHHVLSFPTIKKIVVGIDSLSHLKEIVTVLSVAQTLPIEGVACEDERLLDPSLWT